MSDIADAKQISSVFRWAASKVLLGTVALLTMWLWLAAVWPTLTDPSAYLGNPIMFLVAQTHPWGVVVAGVALALVIGDGLMTLAEAALRLYTRRRVGPLSIDKSSATWDRWTRATMPYSQSAWTRFVAYLEQDGGYEDVLPNHRTDLAQAALGVAPSMIAQAGADLDSVESLRGSEAESVLRIALAPWVLPLAGFWLANTVAFPLCAVWVIVGSSIAVAAVLAVSGWMAWRDSQSRVLQGLCEQKADFSFVVRDFALRG